MANEIKEHQHGTMTGYQYGCRCTACKLSHSQYAKKYTAKNKRIKDYRFKAKNINVR